MVGWFVEVGDSICLRVVLGVIAKELLEMIHNSDVQCSLLLYFKYSLVCFLKLKCGIEKLYIKNMMFYSSLTGHHQAISEYITGYTWVYTRLCLVIVWCIYYVNTWVFT